MYEQISYVLKIIGSVIFGICIGMILDYKIRERYYTKTYTK